MYDRFTDRARKVIKLANEEAQRLRNEYIGTEHILLGLVAENAGVAAEALRKLNIDPLKIRWEIERFVQSGPDLIDMGKLPQTPRVKRVIELAIEEARGLKHNYVGTEHLLLGLLREEEGVAALVLMDLGLTLARVRRQILSLLGHTVSEADEPVISPTPKPTEELKLPPEVLEFVKELGRQIQELRQKKEEAVAEQDFAEAANLRDKEDKLRRRWQSIIQQAKGWQEGAQE